MERIKCILSWATPNLHMTSGSDSNACASNKGISRSRALESIKINQKKLKSEGTSKSNPIVNLDLIQMADAFSEPLHHMQVTPSNENNKNTISDGDKVQASSKAMQAPINLPTIQEADSLSEPLFHMRTRAAKLPVLPVLAPSFPTGTPNENNKDTISNGNKVHAPKAMQAPINLTTIQEANWLSEPLFHVAQTRAARLPVLAPSSPIGTTEEIRPKDKFSLFHSNATSMQIMSNMMWHKSMVVPKAKEPLPNSTTTSSAAWFKLPVTNSTKRGRSTTNSSVVDKKGIVHTASFADSLPYANTSRFVSWLSSSFSGDTSCMDVAPPPKKRQRVARSNITLQEIQLAEFLSEPLFDVPNLLQLHHETNNTAALPPPPKKHQQVTGNNITVRDIQEAAFLSEPLFDVPSLQQLYHGTNSSMVLPKRILAPPIPHAANATSPRNKLPGLLLRGSTMIDNTADPFTAGLMVAVAGVMVFGAGMAMPRKRHHKDNDMYDSQPANKKRRRLLDVTDVVEPARKVPSNTSPQTPLLTAVTTPSSNKKPFPVETAVPEIVSERKTPKQQHRKSRRMSRKKRPQSVAAIRSIIVTRSQAKLLREQKHPVRQTPFLKREA